MSEFQSLLKSVLAREIAEYRDLVACERLSGGASQETYRITIKTDSGEQKLCMRRAPGGIKVETTAQHPGLAAEARLMQVARDAGVPEPEVRHVLTDADGLGEGFIMEWLEGETLGERSKRLGGRLSESSVVRIGAQVASALAAAHEKQIIHRDIKPGDSISMCSDGKFLRMSGQGTVTEAIVAPRPTASSLVLRLGIWARRSWVQTTCWCCAGLARWHQDHW